MNHLKPCRLEHDGRYSCFWSSEAIVKALQPKISPNAVYLTKFDLKKLKLLFEKTLEEISRCGPNPYFFLGNMPQFVVIRSNSLMVFQFQRNTKRSCSVQICHCSLHTNVILKQHELLVSMHHKDDKNLSILTLFIYIYTQNPTVIIQHTTGSTSLHHLHSQPALPVARRWWTRWAAPGNTEEVWNRSHIKSVLEATPKRGCARTLCLMVKKQVIQTINI